MIVLVAKLHCSKKLRTSIMDCSVSTKRLVSSASCDNLVFFLVWYGVSHKFAIIFNVKIDYFPVYNIEEKRQRTPLSYSSKPLLEIIDSVFWYSSLMNFMKISEYPNFRIIWCKNSLSTLSNAFSIEIVCSNVGFSLFDKILVNI